jgi:hypothetical protein
MICASYLLQCDHCGSKDHLNYQSEYNIDTILATYNSTDKCHASIELLDFVVYTAVGELLARIRYIKEEVKSLDMIYGEVHPIYYRLQYYFHGNALVNLFNERASTAMEEPNLLQDSKKEEVKD